MSNVACIKKSVRRSLIKTHDSRGVRGGGGGRFLKIKMWGGHSSKIKVWGRSLLDRIEHNNQDKTRDEGGAFSQVRNV